MTLHHWGFASKRIYSLRGLCAFTYVDGRTVYLTRWCRHGFSDNNGILPKDGERMTQWGGVMKMFRDGTMEDSSHK